MSILKSHFLNKKIFSLALLLVFSVILFLYWDTFEDLFERWETQEEYSHGLIIPLISLYFIWHKKNQLKATTFQSSWWGCSLVFSGLVLFIVGKISILFILLDYSFILILIGLIWSVIGTQALKIIIIPLLILIFAIPLPYYIDAILSSKLQLLSSKLGVEFIVWCKIPVYLEGNIIDLGDFKLQVVEACSGLRYMFPLMSIGFISAYMFNTALWKRVIVFLSSIPITVLMNSFRIGIVGLLVNRWGIETAEGFLHDFEGWIVFMASLGILILEMFLLAKIGKDSRSLTEMFGIIDIDIPNNQPNLEEFLSEKKDRPFYLSLFSMIIVAILLLNFEHRREIIPERLSFINYPTQIKSWQGQRQALDQKTLDLLQLTDYLLADYRKEQGKMINYYVAYYESQRKNVIPHSPRLCIPGGGWEIADFSRKLVNDMPVNRMLIKKGFSQSLVYYWYQQRGQVVANEYKMKWSLFKDALLLNRTDGALVRLSTKIYPAENIAEAENRLQVFLNESMPILEKYVPI